MNPNMIVFNKRRVGFFSRRRFSKNDLKVWVWSTFVLLLMCVGVLWIYYVWTLNVNATKGFVIRKLESEKNLLEIRQDLLSVSIAEKESLNSVMSSDLVKSMEKIDSFEYIVLKNNDTLVYNK